MGKDGRNRTECSLLLAQVGLSVLKSSGLLNLRLQMSSFLLIVVDHLVFVVDLLLELARLSKVTFSLCGMQFLLLDMLLFLGIC